MLLIVKICCGLSDDMMREVVLRMKKRATLKILAKRRAVNECSSTSTETWAHRPTEFLTILTKFITTNGVDRYNIRSPFASTPHDLMTTSITL